MSATRSMVFPWERRFLAGAFGAEFRQGDSALTVARGAGKSTFIAQIGRATLDGPLHQARGETVICAPSLAQARVVFNHVKHGMGPLLDDHRAWRVWDSAQQSLIEHRPTGALLRCVGSAPNLLHGIAPQLIIIDEPAQFSSATSEESYAVLRTSMGKISGSRMIALGTRPLEGQQHFFNDLLEDADYVQSHACVKDTDPDFQKKSWAKACPSLRHGMPALLQEIRGRSASGRKRTRPCFPASGPCGSIWGQLRPQRTTFLTLRHGRLLSRLRSNVWAAMYLRWTSATGRRMCGAAGYWRATGRLEALAAFPAYPTLSERGLRDGVGKLYVRCADRGELFTTPGRAVDVGALLRRVLKEWGRPVAIVADRYRENDLRAALDGVHFPQADLILRGQGWKDGAEDVRQFRRAVIDDEVRPLPSLLLAGRVL